MQLTKSKALIFSKDRAMQLDATIRSFYLHCLDHQILRLVVLFKASNAAHYRQYLQLMKDFPEIKFVPEKNFRRNVLHEILTIDNIDPFHYFWYSLVSELVNRVAIHKGGIKTIIEGMQRRIRAEAHKSVDVSRDPFILFLVDDCLFVRDFKLEEVFQLLRTHPNSIGFSLRLGENTKISYGKNQTQKLPEFTSLGSQILSYHWKGADRDFGYPIEVSSSIFRYQMIAPLIASIPFHQPNKFEGNLDKCCDQLKEKYPLLFCYKTSIAFCSPINIVQQVVANRSGENVSYSVDQLSKKFDLGQRIDVKTLSGFVPSSCHQEVELIIR